jgi:ubiquinone/menaquinone biosynthesis C-methylase UbiE
MTRVSEVNRRFYESPGVAESFCAHTELCPAEALILESIKEEIHDQPLLEIGVGAGRLTPYLMALTKNYIGIDCSRRMIDLSRSKFSKAEFFMCEAESMTWFEDQRFAAAVFCGNGIDEAANEERVRILKEINRVLRKDGVFLLSSHNFDWGGLVSSAAFDSFSVKRGVVHLATSLPLRLWIYVSCQLLRLSARFNRRGYAIFPQYEDKPRITTLVYHISKEAQVEQLMNAGFEQVKTFSSGGIELNTQNRRLRHSAPNGRLDYEVYYVSRKR